MSNNNLDYFKQFFPKEITPKINNDVWIYTRVSSKKQSENKVSLDKQIRNSESKSESQGWSIIKTFGGTYESAKGDFSRKEFSRLIKEVQRSKQKPFAIVINKIHRFSRTGGSAIGLVNELVHNLGVHIVEATSNLDTTSERGEIDVYKALLEARLQNIDKVETITPGMIDYVLEGNRFGRAPKGYDHYGPTVQNFKFREETQRIVVNEDGKLLKNAWKLKLEGMIDVNIIKELDKKKLKVSSQFLSSMWSKPFYCGVSVHKFLKIPINGNWEPMVSKSNYKKVQEIIKKNGGGYEVSKNDDNRPLQHFIKCEKCNVFYTGYNAKNLYPKYKCQNPKHGAGRDVAATTTTYSKGYNDIFMEYLESFSIDSKLVSSFKYQLRKSLLEMESGNADDEKYYKKTIKEIIEKRDCLDEKFGYSNVMDEQVYKNLRDKLTIEIDALENNINELGNKISNQLKLVDYCAEFSCKLPSMWSKSNIETKIEMQRLVFPDGIYLNHENKQYRTNVVNEVIVLSGLQCNKNGGKQNDSVAIKTTESDSVPGAGIEPARP